MKERTFLSPQMEGEIENNKCGQSSTGHMGRSPIENHPGSTVSRWLTFPYY